MSGYPLSELLMGIAQIAIAFVGFSAIIEVFRGRSQSERSQFENLLARTMIEFGFSALFLALMPLIVFRYAPMQSTGLWRALAAIATTVLAAHFWIYWQRRSKVANQAFLMPRVYRAWAITTWAVIFGSIAGLLGFLPPDAAFVAILVWLLASGSISFVVIVSAIN